MGTRNGIDFNDAELLIIDSAQALINQFGLNFAARDWAESHAANAKTDKSLEHWNTVSQLIEYRIREKQGERK